MTKHDPITTAALGALIILHAVMLVSLYAGVAPHPPAATPLFGIAPFIAVVLSAAAGALIIAPHDASLARILAVITAVLAMLSFGPQKYADPNIALIWPAVMTAQGATIVIVVRAVRAMSAVLPKTAAEATPEAAQ